jgi:type II secretory pathway pseudopilin PulG
VVIAIIGILIALLLPAVQMAREAARRSKCLNNIKQIGLAMHNYLGVYGVFPAGALSTSAGEFGHSWLVRILPYLEEETIYGEFDQLGPVTGRLVPDSQPWSQRNRDVLRGQLFPFMFCPSSSLEKLVLTNFGVESPNVMSSTYAGISGARDHPTTRDKNPTGAPGYISWGGVLLAEPPPATQPGQFVAASIAISTAQIKDGTSRTMMVGEQSGWCTDDRGARVDCRSDCGYGFPMGVSRRDTWERQYNLTCVIHPIGEFSYLAYGVAGDCGPNRPLQSAHPGGAQVLMADASGQFIGMTTDIQVVYNLANRDDGRRSSVEE